MGSQFPGHYETTASPWGIAPGLSDPEFKVLTTASTPSALSVAGTIIVSPNPGVLNGLQITWPSVTNAVSYEVLMSFSPFISLAIPCGTVSSPTTTFAYSFTPTVPTDSFPQFWVRATLADSSTILVQSDPATFDNSTDAFASVNNPLETSYADLIVDNDYMRFSLAELRRHYITALLNSGEDFTIYIRRWSGDVCSCRRDANLVNDDSTSVSEITTANNSDPQYSGVAACPFCWGTGIKGGYFLGIDSKLRYGDMPVKTIKFEREGIQLPNNFNTWALWTPRLHAHDLIFRHKTGEMYIISDPKSSEWRGIVMHQAMQAMLIPPGDFRHTVTDAAILAGMQS